MAVEAWVTLAVVALSFGLLAFSRWGTDVVLCGALTLLWTLDALFKHFLPDRYSNSGNPGFFHSTAEVFNGFSNEGVLTVAVLFMAVAALQQTGAIDLVMQRLLGRPNSVRGAQTRMMGPVALLSAFLNNTTVVALFLPVVHDWAKKIRVAPSKLMIPLSYAAVLGGLCTLIGTSTNLIVNGLYVQLPAAQRSGHAAGLGMFEVAWVGVPCALGGLLFILALQRWLLPVRQSAVDQHGDLREYTLEMLVEEDSPLAGKSIEEAGLRHMPSTFLMEIQRGMHVLTAVGPEEILQAGDRLVFVGIVESMVDLQKIRGLAPATDQILKLDGPRAERCLIEAVVSNTNPLAGQSIRDGNFRRVYNAVVIAVGRNGERLRQKIGDIVLQAGDALLLEARPSFVDQQRNSRDFYLLSHLEDSNPPRHERAWIATAIFTAMVAAVSAGWISMLLGGLLAVGLLLITRCATEEKTFRAVQWRVLIAIAASLGIGVALQNTGAAQAVAARLIALGAGRPWLALAAVYAVTVASTELITNNAAAALVFSIAIATANALHVSPLPFVFAVMIGASCGFATPIGYQTHMMVFGPGGYRFRDFLRIGVPLDIAVGVIAVGLIPLIWPLTPLVQLTH